MQYFYFNPAVYERGFYDKSPSVLQVHALVEFRIAFTTSENLICFV